MSAVWMVRAGRNGVHADTFIAQSIVGVGFSDELGAVAPGTSRAELTDALQALVPQRKRSSVINAAGQLYRFHFDIALGDQVVSYDASQRRYYLGEVVGDPEHTDEREDGISYTRAIRWTGRCERDGLTVATRNTLGSTLTIFKLNDRAAQDVVANSVDIGAEETAAKPRPAPAASAPLEVELEVDLDDIRDSLVQRAEEFIEDVIIALDPDEMEQLVAGILRAMGYRARVMPKGSDRGVDVFASPDGLGLEEPRIFVEVKHRNRPMGSNALRAFMGGRQAGDRCLFVSTGGFTHEAKYEAERSNVPLTLVDLPTLRDLLTTHYESADAETRQLVPLRSLYWPVPTDG